LEAKSEPLGEGLFTSIKVKLFRRTAGYTPFDHKRNEGILEELKGEPVDKKLR
jgi:hypothetical protein